MALFRDPDERGPEEDRPRADDSGDGRRGRKSVSTVLVEIAQAAYEFGVSDGGETFAVPTSGRRVVLLLRGGKQSLRAQLAREYFKAAGRAAPQQALADAMLVIEGLAQETDPQVLHLRVARHAGAQWLDLGDPTGRAVKITASGWTIETPPVLFKRTALNAALPEPVRGGDLGEVWQLLNVDADDRPLVLAALIASLSPDIPHPVLAFLGEQGAGKTTAMKTMTMILDPSPVPARKPPRDAESWVTAAAGSWIVGLDNLSEIAPWLSDSICRAVTGEGDVRRKLYTDADLAVFSFRRCIILSGIDFGALRGDLADRTLPIRLHPIDDTHRREESELWPGWAEVHPRILGAVLDLAASVASVLPSVDLESKPRMADFARVVGAVDKVCNTNGLRAYLAKQGAMAADSLEADDFIIAVRNKIETEFTGTSAELLKLVTLDLDTWRAPKDWPANARVVTTRLRRLAPVMRKVGWEVTDDDGANKTNAVKWTIRPPRETRISDSPGSPRSPNGHRGESASQASHQYAPSHDDELIDEDHYADYLNAEANGAA